MLPTTHYSLPTPYYSLLSPLVSIRSKQCYSTTYYLLTVLTLGVHQVEAVLPYHLPPTTYSYYSLYSPLVSMRSKSSSRSKRELGLRSTDSRAARTW